MNYKRMLMKILLMLLLTVFAGSVNAGPIANRMMARHMIKKTAVVMGIAYKQVREHKVYTGDLARAVGHQRFAKFLFHKGEYLRAMHQTRWARHLAVKAIIANNGREPAQAALSAEEQSLTAKGPSEEQLTKELTASMPSEPMKDEALINGKLDADIE